MAVNAPIDLDDVVVRWWKLVIFGAPGVGKSVVSATSQRYRTFVFDVDGEGIASVKAYVVKHKLTEVKAKVWPVNTPADFMAGWKWLFAHQKDFDLVVFDSATEYQAMQKRLAFANNLPDPRQGWGQVLDAMDLITSNFKAMPWHVIVVAHETMKEDAVTKMPQFRPAFQGDWKYQYARHFSVIVRYTMWFAKVKNPVTGKLEDTLQRWFDCGPNPLIHFKDRSGVLNRWEPVDIDALLDKLVGSQTGADGLEAALTLGADSQPDMPGAQDDDAEASAEEQQ